MRWRFIRHLLVRCNVESGTASVIADNLSAHPTKRVAQFLENHPTVHLHCTPTYSSWLNQVELWLAKIERDAIARGIFTSLRDLRRKLMRYFRHYNKTAKPVKWCDRVPSHRIPSTGATSRRSLPVAQSHPECRRRQASRGLH
jgi:transposase